MTMTEREQAQGWGDEATRRMNEQLDRHQGAFLRGETDARAQLDALGSAPHLSFALEIRAHREALDEAYAADDMESYHYHGGILKVLRTAHVCAATTDVPSS